MDVGFSDAGVDIFGCRVCGGEEFKDCDCDAGGTEYLDGKGDWSSWETRFSPGYGSYARAKRTLEAVLVVFIVYVHVNLNSMIKIW